MKRFTVILAMFGQTVLVLWIISAIQVATRVSNISEGATTMVNIFTLFGAITDITYVNYLIWKKNIKPDKSSKEGNHE